jgi:hypothetical protein
VAVAFLPPTLRDEWVSCSNFMKDNKSKQIAILERILSYAEFKKKHLPELRVYADKLKKLRDEN